MCGVLQGPCSQPDWWRSSGGVSSTGEQESEAFRSSFFDEIMCFPRVPAVVPVCACIVLGLARTVSSLVRAPVLALCAISVFCYLCRVCVLRRRRRRVAIQYGWCVQCVCVCVSYVVACCARVSWGLHGLFLFLSPLPLPLPLPLPSALASRSLVACALYALHEPHDHGHVHAL
jgi:hypothetical protein